MRTVRRLLVAALFVAVWYFGWRFAAENASVVSINFLAGQLEGVALWAALIGAFVGGVVVVGAVMLLPMTRTRLVARRYRKMVAGLEAELHQLRNLPLSAPGTASRGATRDLPTPEQSLQRTLERGA
jgi:uncharacterized integral membrane protein